MEIYCSQVWGSPGRGQRLWWNPCALALMSCGEWNPFHSLDKYLWRPYTVWSSELGIMVVKGRSLWPIPYFTPSYTLQRNENKCPCKTCTWMFIAASLTITKRWKQPECPSVDKWINRMWYSYTTESYLARKRNKVPIPATIWMSLENMVLTERSQSQKTMLDDSIHVKIQNRKIYRKM